MKKKEPDILLEILKYGVDNYHKGPISKYDLFDVALKVGYLTHGEHQMLSAGETVSHFTLKKREQISIIFQQAFALPRGKSHGDRYFTLDSYFKYVEYRELEVATKNAKEAKRFSFAAIVISILALIVGAVDAFSPIKLKHQQYLEFQQINDSVHAIANDTKSLQGALDELSKKLDSISYTLRKPLPK